MPPVLRVVLDHARAVVRRFIAHEGTVYAAAIAFYTLVSVVPLVALTVAVAGGVLVRIGAADAGGTDAVLDDLVGMMRAWMPVVDEAGLRATLETVVDRRGDLGVLGLLGLMAAASQVITAVRAAMNRVMGPPPPSSAAARHALLERWLPRLAPLISKLKTYVFLGALGLVVGLMRVVTVTAHGWMSAVQLEPVRSILRSELAGFLFSTAFGLFLTFAGYMAVILHVSRRRTTWRGRVAGAVMFSVLQVVAEAVFSVWVASYARLSVQYGSVANLAALATWVFYSACVFVLSAELTTVVSHPERLYLPPDDNAPRAR